MKRFYIDKGERRKKERGGRGRKKEKRTKNSSFSSSPPPSAERKRRGARRATGRVHPRHLPAVGYGRLALRLVGRDVVGASRLRLVPLAEIPVEGESFFFEEVEVEVEREMSNRKKEHQSSLSFPTLSRCSLPDFPHALVVAAQQVAQEAHEQEAEDGHAEAEHGTWKGKKKGDGF